MMSERTWTLFEIYDEIKVQHPDAVVLVHDGDFYEAYNNDAHTLHTVCDVVLASRAIDGERRPMACVPDYNVDAYIQELVDAGHRVAKVDRVSGIDVVQAT